MTYASVLVEAQALLAAALQPPSAVVSPPFMTVGRLKNQPTPYTPTMYPMLLLDDGDASEERMGMPILSGTNSGGKKLRTWPLTAYLWNYEAGPIWDDTTFLDYIEAVENTFRLNPRMAALADTATTFVLTAAETRGGLKKRVRAIPDGTGGVLRYAEITCLIREGVNG